ncbi:hypothetical protein AC579_1631 [Pseudocercospora musae]|uniref:Uncharacterized protein n=1 Tax=Pseudocercospora musae TaxID=113226 RepID=A0A139HZX0_9PEZI|nr:hypothetical protein AC579_1631 [Pseudocercospora musae]
MAPAKPRRNGALKSVLQDKRPQPETMQRRLPKVARRDPYEMDDSPEKPMAVRKRVVMPGAEISPLKKRTAGFKREAAAQSSADAEEVVPMNRPEEIMTSKAEREALLKTPRGCAPRDREPRSDARAPDVLGPEQLEGDDASSDGLFVGQHDTKGGRKVADAESVRPSEQQVAPQRKRGGPRKKPHRTEGKLGLQLDDIIAENEPSSAKRRSTSLTMKEKLSKVSKDPNPPIPPIERIGNSEVVFPEEEDQPVADNSTQLGDEDANSGFAKAESTRARAKGKLPSKVRYIKGPDERPLSSDEGQSSVTEDEAANARFLGQWPVLKKMFSVVRNRSRRSKNGKNRDTGNVNIEDDVAEALDACWQAKRGLKRLRDTVHDTARNHDTPRELKHLMEKINILCGKDPRSQADLSNENMAMCIYIHLIDRLVDLLRHMLFCYYEIDQGESVLASDMSLEHTRTCTQTMNMILEVGRGAKKYKLTSAAKRLKKSVERDTLLPLSRVAKSFAACVTNIARQQQLQEAQAQEREQREQYLLERQREREERRERDQYEDLRKKWGILHSERRRAEGGCLTVAKQRHLQYKESEPEFDQNGNLFERVEVFRSRAPGPSPAAIAQIRAGKTFRPWSNEALLALVEGLKRWSNDEEMVFTRIIREHCRRGGLLVDRNVTEIVVAAADLKELLSRSQEQSDGYVQEWVRKIPLWTEPRSLLKPIGQENGEEEDADDSDEEEAEAEEEDLGE